MRALAVAAVLATSCGRVDFDRLATIADAPASLADAPPPPPAVITSVASTTGDNGMVATLGIDIPGVTAGGLLIVGIADHHGVAVASIVDAAGTQLVSTQARAVMSSTAAEIWYEPNSEPTDHLMVTMTAPSNFDAFVGEFSGLGSGTPDAVAERCLEYPPDLVSAPVTTTVANELVFSVTMFAYPVFVSGVLPPFTGFAPLTGNDAGYYIAPAIGTYGTTFEIESGAGMAAMTCASTASWRP